jgi:ABC-type antimicrobial peptide transport system permease subunit
MIKANFSINDLRRSPFQTSITITTLALSVASTLFLLIFSGRLGLGPASTGTLTLGLSTIFSQFIIFIGALIFAIGAVLTTFVAFLTMTQRTRDFGLIKAAGCPNSLVGGYYMTELLATTLVGCVLGVALGFLMDYMVSVAVFSSYALPNLLFAPLVFVAFFVLAFLFGLQPIVKAAKMSPLQALSPVQYYGLAQESMHKALSHSALTWRISTRSLFRRQSATIRITFLLSIVFVLLTVTVAGGIIASGTTEAWVQRTADPDLLVVAHNDVGSQYLLLLGTFSGAEETGDFNYSNPNRAVPQAAIDQLNALPSVALVDSRLVLQGHVEEVSNFTVIDGQTYPVGDYRHGESLVVGVDPQNLAGSWFTQGRFLDIEDTKAAVVGDSISQTMYSAAGRGDVALSNPLLEGISFEDDTFDIVGICVDPLSNGFVTYVPLSQLMNTTGINNPNLLIVKLNSQDNRAVAIQQIKTAVQTIDSDLNVFPLDEAVTKNTNFLASNWQIILLLPTFTLVSATLCLVGYMMLTIDEQHQEFAVLRAVGAKPKIIVAITAFQSIFVLLASFGVGILLGTIITLVILMHQPLVTTLTILQISGWLIAALAGMFLLSLYPAFRMAKTTILKIMAQ